MPFGTKWTAWPTIARPQGIDPGDVDDEGLTAFHDALTAESIVEHPYAIYRRTAKAWNDFADRIPGWPQQRLTVPSRKERFTHNWDAFPASLKEDTVSGLWAFVSTMITSLGRSVRSRS
jgi:hypothetical protein